MRVDACKCCRLKKYLQAPGRTGSGGSIATRPHPSCSNQFHASYSSSKSRTTSPAIVKIIVPNRYRCSQCTIFSLTKDERSHYTMSAGINALSRSYGIENTSFYAYFQEIAQTGYEISFGTGVGASS